MPEGKEDEWSTIKLARLMGAKGIIDNSAIVDDEGIEAAAKARMDELRKQAYSNIRSQVGALDDDDDDFDLDD